MGFTRLWLLTSCPRLSSPLHLGFEALARFGFLPFSQLLGARMLPSLCYREAACRSWPGRGHLSTANPHADTHLSTCITDWQTAWTEQEAAEPNFPRKLLNPYHFPLSIPMLLSQTDHRVTRHSRRRCFCSIAITSIKKHGLKPFHQKTISGTAEEQQEQAFLARIRLYFF